MRKKVLKFGGTSVGSIERIVYAANIVKKEHSEGNQIIVVVSAMAGKTNELIEKTVFFVHVFSNTITSTQINYTYLIGSKRLRIALAALLNRRGSAAKASEGARKYEQCPYRVLG